MSSIPVDDTVSWKSTHPDDLWVFDKLILAKKLGYQCGPKGLDVPLPGRYIVRPCVNIMGMGRGARLVDLHDSTLCLPDGFFWCEEFKGRHLSVDYTAGKQVLCVEGIREAQAPLWMWSEWKRVSDTIEFPRELEPLLKHNRHINIEFIGNKVVEVHLRHNPDFSGTNYQSIIPVFNFSPISKPKGYTFIKNKDYMRIGFYVRS